MMEIKYFTYGDIIRVLRHDELTPFNSLMVDVNMDDDTVLSVFDASSRPYDAIFIQSFINILSQSTVGFTQTTDPEAIEQAMSIISRNIPEMKL